MTIDHDARGATGPKSRASESLPALALAASASGSASLSLLDIPAIVRRRSRVRPQDAASSGLVDVADLCFGEGLPLASRTPLLPISADPEPVVRVDQDRRLLWGMTAVASVAVAAMLALVVARSPAPVVVRAEPRLQTAPLMAATGDARALDPRAIEDDEPTLLVVEHDDDAATTDEPIEASADAEIDRPAATTEPEQTSRSTRTKASRSSGERSTSATKAASTPEPTPAKTAKTPASTDTPVECVLDPASCGLGGGGPSMATPAPTSGTEKLPDKLGTTALRSVLGPAKAQAQTCGPRHGAAPGTQVQVKLSIEGSTGKVSSAAALGTHAGTALGRCVAEALGSPVFPRFSAPSQGVVWPIRL